MLTHERTPTAAAELARASIADEWKRGVREYYRIAKLPEAERAVAAAARPELFPQGALDSGLPALLATLDPPALEVILRGDAAPITGELSDQAKQALKFGLKKPELAAGRNARTQTPGFYVSWPQTSVAPILWARNQFGTATNVIGGSIWDNNWLETNGDGWRSARDPLIRRSIDAIAQPGDRQVERLSAQTVAEWIKKAVEKQHFNVLVDGVQPPQGTSGSAVLGRTMDETLAALVHFNGYTWKPEGELQLLRHQSAVVNGREHLLEWKQIQSFRTNAEHNDGLLSLDSLQQLTTFTGPQLAALGEEFPDARNPALGAWAPILGFYARLTPLAQTKLLTSGGILLQESGLNAQSALLTSSLTPAVETPQQAFFRARHALQDVVGRSILAANPNSSRISLTLQKLKTGAGAQNPMGESLVPLWVWEVTAPNLKAHIERFPLRQRVPLRPD